MILSALSAFCASVLFPFIPVHAAAQDGMLAMQRLDQRVTAIGYRLVTSAGDLCPDKVRVLGFAIHDISQYRSDEQQDATEAFGFKGEPLVLAVAPNSPAANFGISAGDALVRIGTHPIARPRTAETNSYSRVAAAYAQLDSLTAIGTVSLELRRHQQTFSVELPTEIGCATRFQTKVSDTIDAQADGNYVEVNTGLIAFVENDDELAAIMAHELAHNVLQHRARLAAAGIARGLLGNFGKNARVTRETEAEADRLGVYLMDRAGYAPFAAITFWNRFKTKHGLGIFTSPTHMREGQRIALIQNELDRMARMRAAGVKPAPDFMESAKTLTARSKASN